MEWDAIAFSNAWKCKVKVKLLSRVRLLVTPWTAAYQAPPPMGFSRQEYWSGVPLPSLTEETTTCQIQGIFQLLQGDSWVFYQKLFPTLYLTNPIFPGSSASLVVLPSLFSLSLTLVQMLITPGFPPSFYLTRDIYTFLGILPTAFTVSADDSQICFTPSRWFGCTPAISLELFFLL